MSKLVIYRILGVCLLVFAVFTPISLWGLHPPFGRGAETIWTYQYISEDPLYSIPGLVYPDPEDERIVRTKIEIEDPEIYNLELITSRSIPTTGWVLGTIPIEVFCILMGIYLVRNRRWIDFP